MKGKPDKERRKGSKASSSPLTIEVAWTNKWSASRLYLVHCCAFDKYSCLCLTFCLSSGSRQSSSDTTLSRATPTRLPLATQYANPLQLRETGHHLSHHRRQPPALLGQLFFFSLFLRGESQLFLVSHHSAGGWFADFTDKLKEEPCVPILLFSVYPCGP